MHYYYGRTICDVIDAMRKLDETRNYSPLKGFIEEAQDMANRMENALELNKAVKKMKEEYKELKEKIKALEKEKKLLEKKKP